MYEALCWVLGNAILGPVVINFPHKQREALLDDGSELSAWQIWPPEFSPDPWHSSQVVKLLALELCVQDTSSP